MAIPHAKPGDLIDVRPLGPALSGTKTYTMIKTPGVEVIRLVLPAGKQIAEHQAPGEIIVQCLEGRVAFTTMGKTNDLIPGKMLHLSAGEPHAVSAIEDSSVLLTILPADSAAP